MPTKWKRKKGMIGQPTGSASEASETAFLASVFCTSRHQGRTCNLETHRQLGYLFCLEAPKLCSKIILDFLRQAGCGKTSGMKYTHRPFTWTKREIKKKKKTLQIVLLLTVAGKIDSRGWGRGTSV